MSEQFEEDPLVLEVKKLRRQIVNNQQQILDIRKELIDNGKLGTIISCAIPAVSEAIAKTYLILIPILFVVSVVISWIR